MRRNYLIAGLLFFGVESLYAQDVRSLHSQDVSNTQIISNVQGVSVVDGMWYCKDGVIPVSEKLYCEDVLIPESMGQPTRGWLHNGVAIDSTICLESVTVDNFGTRELSDLLYDVSCHMYSLTRARLSMHDASGPHGGRLRPHKSHQNGLDVDVGHFRRGLSGYENSTGYISSDAESLAVTWEFVRSLVRHPVGVEYIFWSSRNISRLRLYVIGAWGKEEWDNYSSVFHAERHHTRHMHIRIEKRDRTEKQERRGESIANYVTQWKITRD